MLVQLALYFAQLPLLLLSSLLGALLPELALPDYSKGLLLSLLSLLDLKSVLFISVLLLAPLLSLSVLARS